MYNLAALEAALAGTIFAGKLHYSRTTGSTNSCAVAAARSGESHGSVYFADEQLAGRGRGDHGWVSAAGEGLAVGLAAASAIRAVASLAVDLRWPNDLLIGPRKAGGILVESTINSKGPPHAVVAGIGINVHQHTFPADLATPATSLDLESGRCIRRQTLLLALLKSLEQEALALERQDATREFVARVEKASTWMRGRSVQVHGPQACSGVTDGLDENGFLRIATVNGMVIVQTGGLRENPASSR
jgi:BirA family biotin operon repressor/biotin-[acetyl-CoA-carboxylase] ligase